uniref:Myb-like domain-containing protein n=1 Tax=Kalanchoe fedtschenkoi TaxID=63787 RepID=A0A7N0TXS3_KALFE
MARNGPNPAYFWTRLDHMMLEHALAMYSELTPNRWEMIARAMGAGKTEAEVRAQYRFLVESGRITPTQADAEMAPAPAPTPAPAPATAPTQAPAPACGSGSASTSTYGAKRG